MGICPRTPTRAYTHIRSHIRTHTRPEGSPDLLRLSAGGEGVKVARPGRSARFHGYELKKGGKHPRIGKNQAKIFFSLFLDFFVFLIW